MVAKKEKSLSVLIKEADEVFSEYVRIRDAEPFTGIVTCFVTGEKAHWKKCDAAHWIPRTKLPTRWHQVNVNATTVASNRFDLDHQDMYTTKMYNKFFHEQLEQMITLSKQLMKPTRSDVQDLIDRYKVKVQELRKQKHI